MNADMPDSWSVVTMGELGQVHCGQSPPSESINEKGEGVPYISGPEHWDGSRLTTDKWTTQPKRIVPDGCVFVTVKGAGVGTIFPGVHCAIGRDIYAFEPMEAVDTDFVKHALRFTVQDILQHARGDIPGLTKAHILNHEIGLPPLSEQRRIVSKVEELFSNLDAGLDSLQTAERHLERYRLSVLQAAIEGRLTAGWRGTHSPEPRDKLLEQILEERRTQWEADYRMRRYEVKGNEPPSGWRKRYDSPEPPDEDEARRALPDGWRWVTVDQLSPNIHYGYTESATEEAVGPKFLRISDIQDGKVSWNDVPYCEIGESERKKYLLSPGDIVFARTGGTVGKSYLVRDDVPEAVFASYLIRVITVESFEEDYLYLFFQSLDYWRQISERKTGIGQPNVNATKLSELVLPLPPLPEQRRIVSEVERLLSVSEDGLKTVNRETDRANRLRQSILRKAFSGRLL